MRPRRPHGTVLLASILVVAGVLLVSFLLKKAPEPATALIPPPPPAAPPPAAAATYTVEAALWRVPRGSRAKERLEPGAQLSLGDQLTRR
jgi:hypothetical protein